MSIERPRGLVYRCSVCGTEVAVLAREVGQFAPRCCGKSMIAAPRRLGFYRCDVCGAEIAVLNERHGPFAPRCCNAAMQPAA